MRNRSPRAAGDFQEPNVIKRAGRAERINMAKQLQYRRVMLLALMLGVAFLGLVYRLVDLQVLRFEELSAKARENTRREFLLEPRRGDVLDIKGNLLATSVFVKTVCADPALVGNRQAEVARAVAPLLQMSENELVQRLVPRLERNAKGTVVTNHYVVLKRKVQVETWQKIQAAMTNLSFGLDEKKLPRAERNFYRDLRRGAIYAEKLDDQLRVYPNKELAAHVLGYVGMDEREVDGRRLLETSGKDGIERSFDSKLAGVPGWRLTETDRPGREVVPLREQDVEPRDGLNVVLTIDSVVQHIVESALAEAMEKHSPISISGIVARPRTGEILALATLPNFDPNNPGAAPADARRNRVIADVAEPGSTFKIVVVSGALNDGVVRLSDTFDCEHGYFHFAGHTLRDHESYGVLSVENIITKSSNIGAAKIGIKMGQGRLYDYIRDYGFGTRTGLSTARGGGRHCASGQTMEQGIDRPDPDGAGDRGKRPANDDGDVRHRQQRGADAADDSGPARRQRPQSGGEVCAAARAAGDQRVHRRTDGKGAQDGRFARRHCGQSGAGALYRGGQNRHGAKVRWSQRLPPGQVFRLFHRFFPGGQSRGLHIGDDG